MGRIYAVQGFTGTALKYYDQAINQQQDIAITYANKARLLDQLGKPQEALDLYRLAAQLKPDDRITARLLRAAERRQQIAQDDPYLLTNRRKSSTSTASRADRLRRWKPSETYSSTGAEQ